jgi:hypothetical protein
LAPRAARTFVALAIWWRSAGRENDCDRSGHRGRWRAIGPWSPCRKGRMARRAVTRAPSAAGPPLGAAQTQRGTATPGADQVAR